MSKKIIYQFSVRAELPLTEDADSLEFYTEEAATSFKRRREIERSLFNWLKRFEADCDVELMDFSVEEE